MAISVMRPAQRIHAPEKTPVFSAQTSTTHTGRQFADTLTLGNAVVRTTQKGKLLRVVTFGALQNPLLQQPPALQMRVRGVTHHQRSSNPTQKPLVKTLTSWPRATGKMVRP